MTLLLGCICFVVEETYARRGVVTVYLHLKLQYTQAGIYNTRLDGKQLLLKCDQLQSHKSIIYLPS